MADRARYYNFYIENWPLGWTSRSSCGRFVRSSPAAGVECDSQVRQTQPFPRVDAAPRAHSISAGVQFELGELQPAGTRTMVAHEWIAEVGGSENVFEQIRLAVPHCRAVCLWNGNPV